MAPKPVLKPLITPKTMLFPSELYDSSVAMAQPSPIKTEDSDCQTATAITPPPAYTEFLNALTPTFSPASSAFPKSPMEKSRPSSSTPSLPSTMPPSYSKTTSSMALSSPASASARPHPTRQHRRSLSSLSPLSTYYQNYAYSPSADHHYSPYSARSPYIMTAAADWKLRTMESSRSTGAGAKPPSRSVRHVVTRTVTYRQTPTPALHPAPRGKKRRGERRE